MAADPPTSDAAADTRDATAWRTPQPMGESRYAFPDPAGTPEFRAAFRGFGGLHLARSLMAAAQTIEGMRPHALHAFFLRAVPPDGALTYVVERVRDGRSFATRRTRVLLGAQLLVEATISFTGTTGQLTYQEQPPAEPEPEQLSAYQPFGDVFPASLVQELEARLPFRRRLARRSSAPQDHLPTLELWLRPTVSLPATLTDHAAYLALLSDNASLDVVVGHRPPPLPRATSLDHTLHWHHLPLTTADGWLRFEGTSTVAAEGRALVTGAVWTRDGVRVASVTQEMLVSDVPGSGR